MYYQFRFCSNSNDVLESTNKIILLNIMKYNESTTIMTRNDTTYLNKDNKIINNNNEEIRYK